MKALEITQARVAEWDTLLQQEQSFAMLQSWAWGTFKERLGWKAFRVAVEDRGCMVAGAQMLIKPLPLGLSLAYVPRGPVGNWLNPEASKLLFLELCRLARSQGAVFLKVEPAAALSCEATKVLESSGFHHTRVTNQPRATIVLDLSEGQDSILQGMRKKTRQYVRRAEREGITVRFGNSSDLPAYYELMRLTGKREHFAARSPHYYQFEWEAFSAADGAALLMAYYQARLIAVRAVYRFGSHAAEFHAGSIQVPKLHQNYLLVWEAIKWAAARGCRSYDLWGIPDEIAEGDLRGPSVPDAHDDGLWGVCQFKRGFGKNVVSYIGAYDYVFIPGLYRLLNLVLSWGKWWEHIAAIFESPELGPSPNPETADPGGDQ